MKTLTLEHLAPYLPYGFKARIEDFKCDYVGREFDEIIGFHQWDKSGKLWSVLTEGGAKPSINEIKPILRPLSDLTKEIEHNGEKFVPMVEYSHLRFEEISNYKGGQNVLDFIQFREYKLLIEMHFDFFGLIEQNLAIDINTLEK